MNRLFDLLPKRFLVLFCICGGIIAGLLVYIVYMSRAVSYASDDPGACVNCHIMASSYQSWQRSSHANWATCNDCHVPQHNFVAKYALKQKMVYTMQRCLLLKQNQMLLDPVMPVMRLSCRIVSAVIPS